MWIRRTFGALALVLAIASYALTQAPPSKDGERIEMLIKQLGSTKSSEREKASRELEGIGAPALESLKRAVKEADLETSRRADTLVKKLEEKISTANLLAPKRVRLKVKDMPVIDAVNELAKISGYPIQVNGDRTLLADKKITLDTGEVSFWEALDKLCASGGLSESMQVLTGPLNAIDGGIRVRPPIRIRPPRVVPLPAPGVLPVVPPQAPPQAVPIQAVPIQAQPLQVDAAEAQAPPGQVNDEQAARARAEAEARAAQAQAEARAAAEQFVRAQAAQAAAARAAAAQAAAAQAGQAQAQPAVQPAPPPAVPVQVQVFPGQAIDLPAGFGQPAAPIGTIILTPGQGKPQLTSYAGAVRVRVLPPAMAKNQPKQEGTHQLVLDVAAEPRLQGFRVIGTPTIDKALDDQGQSLAAAMPPMDPNAGDPAIGGGGIVINGGNVIIANGRIIGGMPGMPGGMGQWQRQAVVRLKTGDKQAKMLKELKGHLTAEVIIPNETLISVDNVLKAAGKNAKGKTGGSMTVNTIEKLPNGDYKVKVTLEDIPGNNPFGGGVFNGNVMIQNVQIQIGGGGVAFGGVPGGGAGMPDLVDAKGNKYQLVQVPSRNVNANNGQVVNELTLVFRANNDQGEPARLVLFGNRTTTIQVPFAFQNVPLE